MSLINRSRFLCGSAINAVKFRSQILNRYAIKLLLPNIKSRHCTCRPKVQLTVSLQVTLAPRSLLTRLTNDVKFENIFQNHYKVLGVSYLAGSEEIKAAYHSRVRKFHSDLFPERHKKIKATEMMKKVNVAFDALSDPTKRHSHDLELFECSFRKKFRLTGISFIAVVILLLMVVFMSLTHGSKVELKIKHGFNCQIRNSVLLEIN